MKYTIIICAILFVVVSGCSKAKMENEDKQEFVFRVKKNGVDWKVNAVQGYRHSNDSTFYIQASGQNNELIAFIFKRDPSFVGKLGGFDARVTIPSCELCASIAATYSLDSSKMNRFEILGFDNIESRILARFSVNLKKDRLYDGEFKEEFNTYEGTFSVIYRENAISKAVASIPTILGR
ncbi:hypothetical protein [Parapedobacter sp. DT-150]|uniref:hypothetical protein n=1 Tax=Parapedobacter sp. DT-150 TaxID=3396162 RepID=UPI003F1BCB96